MSGTGDFYTGTADGLSALAASLNDAPRGLPRVPERRAQRVARCTRCDTAITQTGGGWYGWTRRAVGSIGWRAWSARCSLRHRHTPGKILVMEVG